jgi:hypothetical protein
MASPIVQKCSVCGESKGRDDYAGSQWSEGSKKRKCKCCKKRLRGAADAPCTHAPTPPYPALGGQSAAAVAAGDEGDAASSKDAVGGGAKGTSKASVPFFVVSTFSRSVCAVSTVHLVY